MIGNVTKFNKKNSHSASKYVKNLVFDKSTGEIIENPKSRLSLDIDKISEEEKFDVMLEHIKAMVNYKGEHMAMLQARKLVMGYFKGIKGAASLRNEAGKIKTIEDLYALRQKALLQSYAY